MIPQNGPIQRGNNIFTKDVITKSECFIYD